MRGVLRNIERVAKGREISEGTFRRRAGRPAKYTNVIICKLPKDPADFDIGDLSDYKYTIGQSMAEAAGKMNSKLKGKRLNDLSKKGITSLGTKNSGRRYYIATFTSDD